MRYLARTVILAAAFSGMLAGCEGPKQPTAVKSSPPPAPPVVETKPPPAPPQPDPFEVAVGEVAKVFRRFSAIGAEIKDEATADKAVAEMGTLNARLKELAAEISKIPRKPSDDKHMLSLRGDLAKMTTQLSNPANVQAGPELQLKVLPAQLSVVSEGLVAIEQALLSRQAGAAPQPVDSSPAAKSAAK